MVGREEGLMWRSWQNELVLVMARMTRICCYMRSNRSDEKLLVQMMTFKLGVSAAVPLVLENCPNDRVIPNDFLGILILVKVGGHLLTPMKLQRPTFCPKLVKRVDFRVTLFMPQIPDCWRKHVTNFKPVQSLKQKFSRPGIMFTSDATSDICTVPQWGPTPSRADIAGMPNAISAKAVL